MATDNKADSWIAIDLLDKWLAPSFYTLKHPTTAGAEALKHWRFEASLGDAKSQSWEVLKVHANDTKLSAKESFNVQGPAATWPLPATNKRYRSFRIVQTGIRQPRTSP